MQNTTKVLGKVLEDFNFIKENSLILNERWLKMNFSFNNIYPLNHFLLEG